VTLDYQYLRASVATIVVIVRQVWYRYANLMTPYWMNRRHDFSQLFSDNTGGLVRGTVPHLATKKPPIALTDYEELNSLLQFTGHAWPKRVRQPAN